LGIARASCHEHLLYRGKRRSRAPNKQRQLDNLAEHWEISYFPTYALLTVTAGNVSVSYSGSTLLLLGLGLFGLLVYQCASLGVEL
jgi:hypothetical protein